MIQWKIIILALLAFWSAAAAADDHAIAMHGTPKYPAGYQQFGYVNGAAPKGGKLILSAIGSFQSVNPFIIRGSRAKGLSLSFQSLMKRGQDEAFTLYGNIAQRVRTPVARDWVEFDLRPGARFHDGSEITVADVLFSLRMLRDKGRPNHRYYYSQVADARQIGPRSLRLNFKANGNRELPLIMALMPILSQAHFKDRRFDRVSLTPIMGSGPYRIDKLDPGRSITYRRIQGHWTEKVAANRGQNNFDYVRYDYYRDEASAFEAFKAGAHDVWLDNNPSRWAKAYDFPAVRDGRVSKRSFGHGRPAPMFALAFNTRRAKFADPRVRRALMHGFEFQWLNRNLYHGAYTRSESFFQNSTLAARGVASEAERRLLQPYLDSLPADILQNAVKPPDTAATGLRQSLRQATKLLAAAGWRVRDLVLQDANGQPFEFEIMMVRRENQKIALHLKRNLHRLGIAVKVRLVDSAQYQDRIGSYDFDAMFYSWGASLSPGNEQAFYWGSDAAQRPGTRNYPGIKLKAVDALVRHISDAATRQDLIAGGRALDRVLRSGHYVLPLFHLRKDRMAIWNKFAMPAQVPLYGYQIMTWWKRGKN